MKPIKLLALAAAVLAAASVVQKLRAAHRTALGHHAAGRLTAAARQRDLAAFRARHARTTHQQTALDQAAHVIDTALARHTNPQEGGSS